MNERIKELSDKCGLAWTLKTEQDVKNLVEFAESIVREGADVIAPMGDWCGGHGEPRMPSTRECAQRLKEYFGVE